MARPLRIEYPGAFYHVTSRGNEQRGIYKSKKDREQFLHYLETAKERYGAVIHTYCLMDNHFHLLLETPKGNLSQIMRHINGAYTTYFNVKRKRAGHLFQGRYKAILVEADEYAEELSRYIHLNPVRAGLVNKPEEFEWSSHRYYVGKTKPEWLRTDLILGYFDKKISLARKKYKKFVEDSIEVEKESPLREIVASTLLGSAEFIQEITARYIESKEQSRDLPAVNKLSRGPSIEEIVRAVKSELEDEEKLARQVSLYFCHRTSGLKLKEIGSYFQISESGVSGASQRITRRAGQNKQIKRVIKNVEKNLGMCNV